jgi:membrane-associated protease RseP (regulator of RpoE activity)
MRPSPHVRVRSAVAVALGILLSWLGGPLPAAEKDAAYQAALDSISAAELHEHVDYLADDAREGREPGTRGGREAGDYVARQFEADHLPPGGVDGYFQPFEPGGRNVLALVRGIDPRRRHEVIVVGAHYDHVGHGTHQNSRGQVGVIHNGADDNASGTAGLVELAEAFSLLPPPGRSVLFAAWDAEELGMLGSKHWVAHPTIGGDNVVFVWNLDMIGRLRESRLMVLGSRSGVGLRRFLAGHNQDFAIDFVWSTKPNADHWPFFDASIPILTVNTALHDEYHTPADDAELINPEGMRQVAGMVFESLYDMTDADAVPHFREMARRETDEIQRQRFVATGPATRWHGAHAKEPPASEGEAVSDEAGSIAPSGEAVWGEGKPLRLGIRWRVDPAEPGTVVLVGVMPDSPSRRAGLEPGDRIYQVAGHDFADQDEFAERVKTLPGPLELLVERDGKLRKVVLHVDEEPIAKVVSGKW